MKLEIITLAEKNRKMIISAMKKLRNRLEQKNAKKEGLNKPQKKWTTSEIEAGGFQPIRVL